MTSSNGKYEFLSPPENPGEIGTLGSYRVVSELGRGGMGYVFCAEDKRLKRTVALKVMNKKVAATPHSRSRFISEARAMAAVHHDNVATIFEVGEHAGTPFMAMEMLKGETLEDFKLKKQRPNFEQIIRFATETAQGLAAAHAQGIVHRDIKPANIWVESDSERIKILDFGLALAQTPVDQLSGRGSVVGTPGYLSPEQARTEPLDDRSDLYSLGVVLYELATGKLPLRSTTVAGQLIAILAHKPQPIREVNDKIPEPLAELIHKLLRKEPRNRIRSAAELVEELKRVAVECESKSEVGLAINKLQMGLQEVLSKKDSDSSPVAAAVADADPFGAIPDAGFDSLSDASFAAPSDGGSSPSLPAMPLTAAVAGAPPKRPKSSAGKRPGQKPGSKPAEVSPLMKYWPIAAGAGVALIGLIVLGIVMMSDSGSTAQRTSVAEVPPEQPAPTPPPPKQETKPDQQNQSQTGTSADKPKNKNQSQGGGGRKKQQNRAKPNQQKDTTPPKPDTQQVANAKPTPREDVKPNPVMVSNRPPTPPVVPERVDPVPEPIDDPPPRPAAQVITISSTEGRGADATVKRGSGTKHPLGKKPILAIQTRGNQEIQHSYIRFDLAALSPGESAGNQNQKRGAKKNEAKQRNTGTVELILNCFDAAAAGANLRLYGATNPESEFWLEEGHPRLVLTWSNSFSDEGLDSGLDFVQLLAEVPEARLTGRTVKIASPDLAEFIRTTPLQTATLILAGGKENGQPVQFISRDGEAGKAPVLSVELLEP